MICCSMTSACLGSGTRVFPAHVDVPTKAQGHFLFLSIIGGETELRRGGEQSMLGHVSKPRVIDVIGFDAHRLGEKPPQLITL